MANYQNLKNSIAQAIKTNGNQEITGQLLQNTLNSIVTTIGANYTFVGVATPTTNPGAPDQNVFYLAPSGTYPNFGGKTVDFGGIGIFKYNGSWTLELIDLSDYVTEINISKLFPTNGLNGSNKYTLGKAITKIPKKFRIHGIKCSFLVNTRFPFRVTYKCIDSTSFDNVSSWKRLKDSYNVIDNFNCAFFDASDAIEALFDVSGSEIVEKHNPNAIQIVDSHAREGDTYQVSGYGAVSYRLWAFIGNNNTVIAKSRQNLDTGSEPITVVAPAGTTKAIFSSYNNLLTEFSVIRNRIVKQIDEVKSQIGAVNSQIDEVKSQIGAVNSQISMIEARDDLSNIIKKSKAVYATNGNKLESNPNSAILQAIDDESTEGDVYYVRTHGTDTYRAWAFVDKDNNIISKSERALNIHKEGILIKAPANAAKAIFSGYKNKTYNELCVAKNGLVKILYDEFYKKKPIYPLKELEGKTGYFCGDSIMAGRDSQPDFMSLTYYISNIYGLTCHNLAQHGSVFMYPWYAGDSRSIYHQLTRVPKSADYIIVQGGVNGVNLTDDSQPNYAPMGQITQGFIGPFDKTTQIGALEAICEILMTQFPEKKVGFIINYSIGASPKYWAEKLIEFKKVLEKWSVPTLDWHKSGINLSILGNRTMYGLDTWASFPTYSPSLTYDIDDKVIYEGKAYKADVKISVPEPFDPSKWTLITSDRYDSWHANAKGLKMLSSYTAHWMASL